MVACFEVFQTWDDEYEKLQVLLRDIVKRKREENLKMVWRINPAHRKLQSRLDQMRKFRRQHEQLRAVIVRVLRPQVILIVTRQKSCVPFCLQAIFYYAEEGEGCIEGGDCKCWYLGIKCSFFPNCSNSVVWSILTFSPIGLCY